MVILESISRQPQPDVQPSGDAQPRGGLRRSALRREVVGTLLTAILRGELPSGSRLIIMKLAEQFGTSSTPIREALVELESIGLIQFVHNRGAVVKPFGAAELGEVYQIRRILEVEATRCACGRIDRVALETLHDKMIGLDRSTDGDDWDKREMSTDRQLHEMIVANCGSARLADEIRRYNALIQTGREIVGNQRRAQQRALGEHMLIVDALLACDVERASSQMARHIESTRRTVEAVMFFETP